MKCGFFVKATATERQDDLDQVLTNLIPLGL